MALINSSLLLALILCGYAQMLCTVYGLRNGSIGRILGGHLPNNRKDMKPYLVSIEIATYYPRSGETIYTYCGGSLITKRIVLTAAHCVYMPEEKMINVSGGGIKRLVESIVIPHDYIYSTNYMDIAGLILQQTMEGPNIATISLCTDEIPNNRALMIAGWGATGLTNSSNVPKLGLVAKLSDEECRLTCYKPHEFHSNVMFCAKHPYWYEGPSDGDSGGPVVFDNKLCGIISHGKGGFTKNYPDVYTKITGAKLFTDELLQIEANKKSH